uniref:Uncharacterized protein LOC101299051 n=1 Tax=Rhizophora mucronata TaxID=61149 RepID=A0A2P2J0S6_RHIMU
MTLHFPGVGPKEMQSPPSDYDFKPCTRPSCTARFGLSPS